MANIYNMADTWDNVATTFTAIKMNVTDTASASGSLLMDLQVGGASKFNVNKIGELRLTGATVNDSASFGFRTNAFTPEIYLATNSGGGKFFVTANEGSNQGRVALASTVEFGFSSNSNLNSGTTIDVVLRRDAANTLAQRNSTNAQTFNLYNTYTNASNYERGFMKWNSNVLEIGAEAAGTGTARTISFLAGGSSRLSIATTGVVSVSGSEISTASSITYFGSSTSGFTFRYNNGANSDLLVRFAGTTSSFPAIKRSTTSLQARLADDSAFTNIQGKLTTETAYTAGAPTATGYIVLYDSTGTAYKVPAEAL